MLRYMHMAVSRRGEAQADHVDEVLAEWRRERPGLDLAPVAVVARIGRAAALLDRGLNANFARFGLNRTSWDVLASLRRVGAPCRRSPTELYRALMRTSGAMTHILDRLEQDGIVERLPRPPRRPDAQGPRPRRPRRPDASQNRAPDARPAHEGGTGRARPPLAQAPDRPRGGCPRHSDAVPDRTGPTTNDVGYHQARTRSPGVLDPPLRSTPAIAADYKLIAAFGVKAIHPNRLLLDLLA
jgi:hypothetical protein